MMKEKQKIILVFLVLFFFIQPLYAGVQYHFNTSLSTGMEYDDNIYLDPDHEVDDWNFTVNPSISWQMMAEHAGLEITYQPGINSYVDDSSLNYISHNLTARANYQPWEYLELELTNHYLLSEDPLDDTTHDNREGIIRGYDERQGRNTFYRNDSSLRATYTFGADRLIDAGYRFGLLQNDDPTSEDSKEHALNGHLGFRFDEQNMIDLDYVFTRGLYEGPDDFSSHDVTSRYTYTFSPFLDVYGEVGYTDYLYDHSSLSDDWQEYEGNLGLTYRFWEYYTLDLSYGRYDRSTDGSGGDSTGNNYHASLARDFERQSFTLSFDQGTDVDNFDGSDNGYTEFWRVQASFTYAFADRWSLTGSGLVGNDDYKDALTSHDEDSYQANVSVSYAMLPWLSLTAGYTYDENDSTINEDDYTDNRITFQAAGHWNIF
ncbi:MAG: outer membrane beta-barrel protein [Xanthomonadaceae bacterium]|nr:outer membrane beta-barrel protein [Xanthomonadaceae bacterium]